MSASALLFKLRQAALLVATICIWLVLGMVYLDRFPSSLGFLREVLMPWKSINVTPAFATLGERLTYMQGLLHASDSVAKISFTAMLFSFVVFSVYLSVIYQQRKRRIRENELLLIKNQEIARRNEFIRYISATIGHEFKNNLGRIKRRIDLLPELPPELRGRIDANLHKLFADIDIFKKISDEREARLIDFRRINLESMIRNLATQYGDMADINITDGKTVPDIFASPALLMTVFENLIDNSIKYKKSEQKVAKISIGFSYDHDGRRRYVTVSVRDEGMGMDEELADLCFYKGKSTSAGWGQGLYFVKYVVGLHAGKVRVGNEFTAPGKGTEIIINLPLVEEELNV
jgi:signal transduction histidine kinase